MGVLFGAVFYPDGELLGNLRNGVRSAVLEYRTVRLIDTKGIASVLG